ncbi:MAG: methylated-DNA--[protein]-cysteine S-methyltransferase [Firmicutes bacterium]|nr:methylated-DNA--[protein]-cysteine S-methyltransferase [Bacillota bacterium]
MYICRYRTPKEYGDLIMASDGEYLTALLFDGSKNTEDLKTLGEEQSLTIFEETKRWLDIYFTGKDPGFLPRMKFENLSSFRAKVLEKLLRIPYGRLVSYGDIAREIAKEEGINKMSAQAVGRAVGRNPICIIVPCHRVLGAGGKLTGYGGGLENKKALLKLEKIAFKE